MSALPEHEGKPSASAYQADSLCPGRHLAQAGLPDERTADSDEGDRIHAWLAWACGATSNGVQPPGPEPELSEDERETAERCLKQAGTALWPEEEGAARYIEHRFWFYRGREKMFSGRFDFAAVHGQTGIMIDWKAGRIPVPHARENMQLRAAAVLLKAAHPHLTEIRVAIVQPWCGQPTHCVYDEAALAQARAELIQHIVRITTEGAPRVPGEAQCRYCLAKGTARCPESMALVQQGASLALPDGRRGELLSAEEWRRGLEVCAAALPVIEAFQARAKRLLAINPDAIPGWYLKPGASPREITDSVGAYTAVSGVLSVEQFAACTKVGVTALGDAYAAEVQKRALAAAEAAGEQKPKKPTKKALLQDLGRILEPFITHKQNEPSLERTSAAA